MAKAPLLVLLFLIILFYTASAATIQTQTSTSIKEKNATLIITPTSIQAIIPQGGTLASYFIATATIGNLPLNFSVVAAGDFEDQINFTDGSFFTLQPTESARVNFTIAVPSNLVPSTYDLVLIINDTTGATNFVNMTVVVTKQTPSLPSRKGGGELVVSTAMFKGTPLFNVIIDVVNATLTEGEFLTMFVNITNFGTSTDIIDVKITYNILDTKDNLIYTKTETRAIGTGVTYEKSFSDVKLLPGNYSINTIAIYGEAQKAVAINVFVVNKFGGVILAPPPQTSAFTIDSKTAEILLIIMFVWILYQRTKKKQHMRRYH